MRLGIIVKRGVHQSLRSAIVDATLSSPPGIRDQTTNVRLRGNEHGSSGSGGRGDQLLGS